MTLSPFLIGPNPVSNLRAEVHPSFIILRWDPPEPADGFPYVDNYEVTYEYGGQLHRNNVPNTLHSLLQYLITDS